jgi:hypothetical protein
MASGGRTTLRRRSTATILSERIRRPQRVGLILVTQLLLGRVPELVFAAFGLAGELPQLVGALSDLLLARLGQLHLLS